VKTLISKEMQEAIATIRAFLDGTAGKWDWDDFLSTPAVDPSVKWVQGYCLQLRRDFPPENKIGYCSDTGMKRLADLLTILERQC
jgi:hypothetical protein